MSEQFSAIDMAAISASAMAVSAVPQAATASVASDKLAFRSSVPFSNVKAFRPMTFLCRSSVRPLAVRAVDIPHGSEVVREGANGMRVGNIKHRTRGYASQSRRPFRLDVRAVKETTGSVLSGEGLRFAVVVARFNEIVTRPLVAGALETFHKYAVKDEDVDVLWVPGSFEIPLVCQQLGKSGKYEAIVAIGAVIRGATTHYEAVAGSAASGVMSASLNAGVPIIFGVLTVENMEQGFDRAGGKAGNKGAEAALTAIEMASLFKHHIVPLMGSEIV